MRSKPQSRRTQRTMSPGTALRWSHLLLDLGSFPPYNGPSLSVFCRSLMTSRLPIIGETAPDHDHDHAGAACTDGHVAVNIHPESGVPLQAFRGRAGVVTLGCAKNQVDSEIMLGVLRRSGYEIVSDVERADVLIVNTCGFLESAVKEGIDCVLELADLKERGQLRRLIVAGCMVERYGQELKASMPEVDAFMTTSDLLKSADVAGGSFSSVLDSSARPYFLYDDAMPRQLSTPSHTAYVKIAEGCNRPCTFCIIPRIRGAMRSRSLTSVVREVQSLGAQGVREINLVAQDLTAYGEDQKGASIVELLRALDQTRAVDWIRLLYAYPLGVNEELLRTIVELPSVCNYLDIPLQHASERVLREMRRPLGKFSPRKLVEFIHKTAPQIHVRTTFIVGFPGETEADVDELESLIREGDFSHVGIFTYSAEQGTPAHDMAQQVPQEVKDERRDRLMLAQQEVMEERLQRFVGERLPVLVEGPHEESDLLLAGRTAFQAPEVDGSVIINDVASEAGALASGSFVDVEITEVAGYDLVGTAHPMARAAHG